MLTYVRSLGPDPSLPTSCTCCDCMRIKGYVLVASWAAAVGRPCTVLHCTALHCTAKPCTALVRSICHAAPEAHTALRKHPCQTQAVASSCCADHGLPWVLPAWHPGGAPLMACSPAAGRPPTAVIMLPCSWVYQALHDMSGAAIHPGR